MAKKTIIQSYNPLYLALKEQISTENVIFQQKNDVYTTALTLIPQECYSNKFIKDSTKELINKVKLLVQGSESLSYFKEAGLILGLANRHGIGGAKEIEQYVDKCLVRVGKSSTPPQALGNVGYLLVNVNYKTNNFDTFQKALSDKIDSFVHNNNLNAVLDLSIGVKSLSQTQKSWILEQAEVNLGSLSLERIAKLVIVLTDNKFVSRLEEVLSETIGTVTYPDIGFSIFEAQKIINSNIPNASMKNILEELKKVDTSWARMITAMEADGITIDLAQLHKVPSFSPHQDIWSIIGLQKAGRAKTVQVNEKEYKEFIDYSAKSGKSYQKLNIVSILAVVVISILQSLYVYYLFDTQGIGLQDTLKNLSLQNYIMDIHSSYFVFVNSWLQLGVAIIWIPTLLLRLFVKGRLTVFSTVLSWPVLLPFYEAGKWIKNRIFE